jgi:triphosphatase
MANEIELKLRINQLDATKFKRLLTSLSGNVEVSPPLIRNVLSTYYDTPTLTLLDEGISIRLRRDARKWMQTIKDAGSALSGLHQRMELESELKSGYLDFSKITDPTYAKFFSNETLRSQLIPIFSTKVKRTEWQLTFDNGDKIELVLDIGELVAGENRESISEIELELKQGHVGRLFEFALQLQKSIPLSIENISKAQRGYRFYRTWPLSVVKASPIKLKRKMNANSALKQITQACLTQLQSNQAMVLYGKDVEGVHQMRIALRRLRSALKVFKCMIDQKSIVLLTEELKWITNILGQARDFDVFTTQTLPPMLKQIQNQPSLHLLEKKAKQARSNAYIVTREAIHSQRYQRLLLSMGDWLENERWQIEKAKAYTVYEVAQKMLSKRYQKLKQSGKHLAQDEAEERHATRIAAKKLRYAAEFFAQFYATSKSDKFIKRLSQLQDQLGMLNDTSGTNTLVASIFGPHPPHKINKVQDLFKGWNAHKLMQGMNDMQKAWQKFIAQKPFW